jgi:hypothetical protein
LKNNLCLIPSTFYADDDIHFAPTPVPPLVKVYTLKTLKAKVLADSVVRQSIDRREITPYLGIRFPNSGAKSSWFWKIISKWANPAQVTAPHE